MTDNANDRAFCDYCDGGMFLEITMLDVNAFSESVEAFIDGNRIVVEKYDGDLRIKANCCPMCGRDLRGDKR